MITPGQGEPTGGALDRERLLAVCHGCPEGNETEAIPGRERLLAVNGGWQKAQRRLASLDPA
jgi:hypothetical protein